MFLADPFASTTVDVTSTSFTLSQDQQNAMTAFYQFLCDPIESVFVLRGYSGCGKSTLLKTLLDRLPNFLQAGRLINPRMPRYDVALTATTNKAAENLSRITGQEAGTIHSFLGLRVQRDYKTQVTKLVPRNMDQHENELIFIDEASLYDHEMLTLTFKLVNQTTCKIVFVGDPAQLAPVKSSGTPVFNGKFSGAELKEVVRQAKGNPIVDLSTQFRHTVNTGVWTQFKPDGHHVKYLERDAFEAEILKEFSRPDWRYHDSKILAWTNACVINFNKQVRNHVKGSPHFEVGDYAVCNSFITIGNKKIKTDDLVQITDIEEGEVRCGVPGTLFTLDNNIQAFMPVTLEARNAREKEARANNEITVLAQIEQSWIDLRSAYAQTINKAQGSTYDRVFVDLDDVSRCPSGDQIARMLYVGVSRARDQVFLTGDIK